MRDCIDRQVTPPKRVSSPTVGPAHPCKQALRPSMVPQRTVSFRRRAMHNCLVMKIPGGHHVVQMGKKNI